MRASRNNHHGRVNRPRFQVPIEAVQFPARAAAAKTEGEEAVAVRPNDGTSRRLLGQSVLAVRFPVARPK